MRILLGLALVLLYWTPRHDALDAPGHLTNEFAVVIDGDNDVADLVAGAHGFDKIRKLVGLDNAYVFSHPRVAGRSRRGANHVVDRLRKDPNVKFAEQQQLLKRVKRVIVHDKQLELPINVHHNPSSFKRFFRGENGLVSRDMIPGDVMDMDFKDPYYPDQWYYNNYGQTGGKRHMDLNVIPAWKNGFTGKGVVVVVLDDGIEHTHPDLRDNYMPEVSTDFNDRGDDDPMPDEDNPDNSHGTRCAGEIAAAANNSVCGVGIAYEARIGGVRILDGPITDSLEAEALIFKMEKVDIYSASWGPPDDGKTMEAPKKMCQAALKRGVEQGRGGKGNIYAWATGNGGMYNDSCSCDGYVSSPYTLPVGSINDQGYSTYYSEQCPATMAVCYTGGSHGLPGNQDYKSPTVKVVTTDIKNDCTLDFEGTSSAAPLAAGCFALVLQANPDLTWRDMQHIVVRTARIPNDKEEGWTMNGAGFHVNPHFGFGALDCSHMVEVAQTWQTVPDQNICYLPEETQHVEVPNRSSVNLTVDVKPGCSAVNTVKYVEHVQVRMHLKANVRGMVNIILTSPMGTRSNILTSRPRDKTDEPIDFLFLTVHNWGENPQGTWTLTLRDASSATGKDNDIVLKSWQLILWGTERKPQGSSKDSKSTGHSQNEAYSPDQKEVKIIMTEENQVSEDITIASVLDDKSTSKTSGKYKKYEDEPLSDTDIEQIKDLFGSEIEDYKSKRSYHSKRNQQERTQDHEVKSYTNRIRELIRAIVDILDDEDTL